MNADLVLHHGRIFTGEAALPWAEALVIRQGRIAFVGERAGAMPSGQWVRGHGWDQNEWAQPSFPDRRALDEVAPDNPVALAHTSGHATWVNSRALALAGVG